MAAIPVSTMKLFLLSSFMTIALLSQTVTVAGVAAPTKPQRLVTKLIHRDSIFSPYYSPNATAADRAKQIQERSDARLRYISRTLASANTDDVRARLIPDDSHALFLVNLSIGEPPVPQLLAIDTGSNLLWLQCEPCKHCYKQQNPIFDPSKSSTYKILSCDSPDCNINSAEQRCDPSNNCQFTFRYVEGSNVSGIIGTEKFSNFFTSDEGVTSVPDVIFGCSHDNYGNYKQFSGVLGLATDSYSFATKLGSKFSYCLGNLADPEYPYNLLVLGDGAIIEGDTTPLDVFNFLYYLTVESISIGETQLGIDPKVFQRDDDSGNGGVVIDSGSFYTYLAEGAYSRVAEAIQSMLDKILKRVDDPKHQSGLCYKGDINKDVKDFPVIAFHFAGGAELALDAGSLFYNAGSDVFCVAISQSIPALHGLNVIGVMAQQNYNIAYDSDGEKLSIQRIDCQLLD